MWELYMPETQFYENINLSKILNSPKSRHFCSVKSDTQLLLKKKNPKQQQQKQR